MTMTITLDDKARGRFRRFGGKPGQKFTARTDGPSIVLELLESDDESGDDWKPTMTVAELYRSVVELPQGFGKRMPTEKIRRVKL